MIIDLADCEKLLKREISSFDFVAKYPKLNLWEVGSVVKRLVILLLMLAAQIFFVYPESEFFPHLLRSWVYVVGFLDKKNNS